MSDSGSGSTTNPNTPRSAKGEVTRQEEVPHEDVLQKEIEGEGLNSPYNTTTTSSSGSDHDLHPTWPKSLDVTDIPAMATWGPSGDASLGNLWFDLHWHRQSHVAFFTLRTSVRMPRKKKNRARTGNGGARAVFYIYIHPERIRELSLLTNPAKQPLGAGSLLLKFVLDKPLALVMPIMIGGDNNDENAKELLDSCQRLAAQTSFQLHIDVSGKRLTVKQLQELCSAACGTGLSSSKRHARTDTLYHGQGGRVVDGVDLEPPPLYSESAGPERTSVIPSECESPPTCFNIPICP